MNTTQFAVIALTVVALGTMGIIAAGAPAAEAAQKNAPGQNPFGNPGQCQLTQQEIGATKETAHDKCHEHAP